MKRRSTMSSQENENNNVQNIDIKSAHSKKLNLIIETLYYNDNIRLSSLCKIVNSKPNAVCNLINRHKQITSKLISKRKIRQSSYYSLTEDGKEYYEKYIQNKSDYFQKQIEVKNENNKMFLHEKFYLDDNLKKILMINILEHANDSNNSFINILKEIDIDLLAETFTFEEFIFLALTLGILISQEIPTEIAMAYINQNNTEQENIDYGKHVYAKFKLLINVQFDSMEKSSLNNKPNSPQKNIHKDSYVYFL